MPPLKKEKSVRFRKNSTQDILEDARLELDSMAEKASNKNAQRTSNNVIQKKLQEPLRSQPNLVSIQVHRSKRVEESEKDDSRTAAIDSKESPAPKQNHSNLEEVKTREPK